MDHKTHWEKIYRIKSPLEVSWYQREPAVSLALIDRTRVDRDAPIVDVGGGASVLVDRLLARGYLHVSVLDVSAKALHYAKERLGGLAGSVEWFEADITTFRPPHRFRVWHDRAVFHFLTDPADRRAYVKVLTEGLEPSGHLIIATFAIGGPTKCSGLDICQYDAARMGAELGSAFELQEEVGEIHATPAGKEQRFIFLRYRRRESDTG
jgi:2-polyprenyl-3-methyl-5-hydroxy-6-metoxy-1,4-benzoquinol methylase